METLTKENYYLQRELGIALKEQEELIRSLNRAVANMSIHAQKMRNFHWNIKGQNFIDLHAKFENMFQLANKNTDLMAERIRVMGENPYSTLKQCLDMADIKEVGTHFSAWEMVKETISDFNTLLNNLTECINCASEIGDVVTVDMTTKIKGKIEKNHWMLTSWLNRE